MKCPEQITKYSRCTKCDSTECKYIHHFENTHDNKKSIPDEEDTFDNFSSIFNEVNDSIVHQVSYECDEVEKIYSTEIELKKPIDTVVNIASKNKDVIENNEGFANGQLSTTSLDNNDFSHIETLVPSNKVSDHNQMVNANKLAEKYIEIEKEYHHPLMLNKPAVKSNDTISPVKPKLLIEIISESAIASFEDHPEIDLNCNRASNDEKSLLEIITGYEKELINELNDGQIDEVHNVTAGLTTSSQTIADFDKELMNEINDVHKVGQEPEIIINYENELSAESMEKQTNEYHSEAQESEAHFKIIDGYGKELNVEHINNFHNKVQDSETSSENLTNYSKIDSVIQISSDTNEFEAIKEIAYQLEDLSVSNKNVILPIYEEKELLKNIKIFSEHNALALEAVRTDVSVALSENIIHTTPDTENDLSPTVRAEALSENEPPNNNDAPASSNDDDESVEYTTRIFTFSFKHKKNINVATKYQHNTTSIDKDSSECKDTIYDENKNCKIETSSSDESEAQIVDAEPVRQSVFGFFTSYNDFLLRMADRLESSRRLIQEMRATTNSIEEISSAIDVNESSEANNVPPESHDNIIDRLLNTTSPLFELSSAELDREISVLQDNSFNRVREIVENVYERRDEYNVQDNSNTPAIESIDLAEVEETYFNDVRSQLEEQKLMHAHHQEQGNGVTFYCENVEKLLLSDCESPDLIPPQEELEEAIDFYEEDSDDFPEH